jgi:hypothetical protein
VTWAIECAPAALRDFYAVPSWTTAARIDEALQRLASTGQGELRRIEIDGTYETRLLVPPYALLVTRDRPRRTIVVWRILRYA